MQCNAKILDSAQSHKYPVYKKIKITVGARMSINTMIYANRLNFVFFIFSRNMVDFLKFHMFVSFFLTKHFGLQVMVSQNVLC